MLILRHCLLAVVCAHKNLAYQTFLIMYINLQFCITITENGNPIFDYNYNRYQLWSDAFVNHSACLSMEVKAAGVPGLGEDAEDMESLIICFDVSYVGIFLSRLNMFHPLSNCHLLLQCNANLCCW